MSANGSTVPQQASELAGKGKGKSVDQTPGRDVSMDDEDDEESEESGPEEQAEEESEDEDNMEAIDVDNIIRGSRTRGKQIDWEEAEQKALEAGDPLDEDEDDDDDDDFEDPDDQMKD